jgi:hypothetical protein
MTRPEASDRVLWVNVASGLLVLAGIFGVLNWLLVVGPFSEFAYVPPSGVEVVEVEMPAEGDWRALDDAGDVVFEGSPDEFERWYDEFERWREGRRRGYLRSRYLYPGAALIGLGVAIWYFGPRREAPSAGS